MFDDVERMRIDACVELICARGCKSVWRDIERLKEGMFPPGYEDLSGPARLEVIRQLSQVMQVYSGRCSVD